MKFSAMAAAFEQQLKDPKSYSLLGFEERFGLMVDAEWKASDVAICVDRDEWHGAAPFPFCIVRQFERGSPLRPTSPTLPPVLGAAAPS